ncbi:unnamed protein product [Bursaphelenchus okinawaensis]|uniref:Lariat debranching enzyme C-terminal domain-containing protein n=1 Tax=Bursaphelenchus okinawaensis TaxID=465554 RepID=A0A811JU75_9BILA|nr:unnamed protein product [Bursaphelenchus okinawaensis]CAG9083244.1 unnamed protein product [Bursaphelenchus okinawaensis]
MSIKTAVVGCAHGELDQIYRDIRESGQKVDLLLCCGDFQAIRNRTDLNHIHCPEKYRELRTFYKYYSGEQVAPVLTVFIGGNHESIAFSQELPHGGWVAPNIYYLGFASVINFGGLRIGGWSGIYKHHDYMYNHFEAPPFLNKQEISAYHVRSIEHYRLQLLQTEGSSLDIFMTHDWPNGITKFGNEQQLLRFKHHIKNDVDNNTLGNAYSMDLIKKLKPRYHFSGHMHALFPATVPHGGNLETKFTALSKCAQQINVRNYLNFFDITPTEPSEKVLKYDAEWLAILQNTRTLEQTKRGYSNIPNDNTGFTATKAQMGLVVEKFGDLKIPDNFKMTAPPENALAGNSFVAQQALYYRNPQTKELCEKLEMPDWNEMMCRLHEDAVGIPYYAHLENQTDNNAEINLDADDLFGDDDIIEDPTPQNRSKRPLEEDEDGQEVEAKKDKTDLA